MPHAKKKVAISAGPIPARLDSVKFITNRFKGGLALKTAGFLASQPDLDVTLVMWDRAVPDELPAGIESVAAVGDVFEYYDWFVRHAKEYDAFVMAAAVANLTPVKPFKGKFPSHLYAPGDEFDIKFMIAPRAIDAIKPLNPRCCLIGYKLFDAEDDEALAGIARHTLEDSKANVVFANRPSDAKDRKLALTQDDTVMPCGFQEHLDLMLAAIRAEYYRTEAAPMPGGAAVREALATVRMYEKTFPDVHGHRYGTVAVPVRGMPGAFATTARGHAGDPVLVLGVDAERHVVTATGKATLNAPALAAMLDGEDTIVLHRHYGDPLCASMYAGGAAASAGRQFPGTVQEERAVRAAVGTGASQVDEPGHGTIRRVPVRPVDWTRYRELFPDKYFGVPDEFRAVLDQYAGRDTLEVGGNRYAEGKYAYDPYAPAENAVNLTWQEVLSRRFDLVFARNALNYLDKLQIRALLDRADAFVANSFLSAPDEKHDDKEAAVLDERAGMVRHILMLPDGSLIRHAFHAYGPEDFRDLGLETHEYGRNSVLLTKGIEI